MNIEFGAAKANFDSTITWKELIALEPRLLALYKEAKTISDDKPTPSFCPNRVWYGRGHEAGLKEKLCSLVGHHATESNRRLRTSRAYDVAYRKVYDALPACRHCSCLALYALIAPRLATRQSTLG